MNKLENKLSTAKWIHLISLGNKMMFDLAISLKKMGYEVSGSYKGIGLHDFIRLEKAGIEIKQDAKDLKAIGKDILAVVPATEFDSNNPELLICKEEGVLITSLPEFIFECAKNKVRVVVSGSKNRSFMLSLVLHMLNMQRIEFDYFIQTPVNGFEQLVKLSANSRIAIIEGNEFFTSIADKQPILHFLRPHIALITDINWSPSPLYEDSNKYIDIFRKFVEQIERNGKLIYCENAENVQELAALVREDITAIPYDLPTVRETAAELLMETRFGDIPIAIPCDFPKYEFLQQINGARLLCRQLGVQDRDFYSFLSDYTLKKDNSC
ncbi:MAG: Mur ligase domain-containing protein [Bacteroidales bacterium]|jgi:UDP-N-acetylmuramate: L-alanyl-gamma-D-glutamyl-meso-diaminopimelate ligase|nr:Mur ligase domain-containing protein [Bacteroidales bacterium]